MTTFKIAREIMKELGLSETLHNFDLDGGMRLWFKDPLGRCISRP